MLFFHIFIYARKRSFKFFKPRALNVINIMRRYIPFRRKFCHRFRVFVFKAIQFFNYFALSLRKLFSKHALNLFAYVLLINVLPFLSRYSNQRIKLCLYKKFRTQGCGILIVGDCQAISRCLQESC